MRLQRLFTTRQCPRLYYLPTTCWSQANASCIHPTRPNTHSCANRYRPLTTSSLGLHLRSPSPGVIMARTGGTSSNTNIRINRPHPQNAAQRARTYSQSQSRRSSVYRTSIHSSSTTLHLSWLFRSNLPPRRGMPIPADIQKRTFFGVGEIIGVLANVSSTTIYFLPRSHEPSQAIGNTSLLDGVQEDVGGNEERAGRSSGAGSTQPQRVK